MTQISQIDCLVTSLS
uniref:Uncharacterized protein n=1 Tax=Anguilla anguilla TaxID=7936 RepID=A0A0E9U5Y3_ANGAN